MGNRTTVYVDGFNLYYRALKDKPHKWLSLYALAARMLPNNAITEIKYYTAAVSGKRDPGEPHRQAAYLRALRTTPGLSIFYGKFLPKIITRPLVNPPATGSPYVAVHSTEEKGSDVNLASHLIRDGFLGRYDVAVVLSKDTDLREPHADRQRGANASGRPSMPGRRSSQGAETGIKLCEAHHQLRFSRFAVSGSRNWTYGKTDP